MCDSSSDSFADITFGFTFLNVISQKSGYLNLYFLWCNLSLKSTSCSIYFIAFYKLLIVAHPHIWQAQTYHPNPAQSQFPFNKSVLQVTTFFRFSATSKSHPICRPQNGRTMMPTTNQDITTGNSVCSIAQLPATATCNELATVSRVVANLHQSSTPSRHYGALLEESTVKVC